MENSYIRRGGLLVAAITLSIFLGLHALSAAAAPNWIIAAPEVSLRSDEPIELVVIRPTQQVEWPDILRLRLEQDSNAWDVMISAVGTVAKDDTRRTYRGAVPAQLSGLIRGRLSGVESNQLALFVRVPDEFEQIMTSDTGGEVNAVHTGRALSVLVPEGEGALSVNEPMYFVFGNGGVARFQLSFKYRMFDPDSLPVARFSPLGNFYLGYTQTSVWDLSANSKPFRDTSYRPSFFWQGTSPGDGLMPDVVRAGFEHESNGKEGLSSRSINMLFVQPAWLANLSDGHIFGFGSKVYAYQDKLDNPDIQRYRGYADWELGYGRTDGAMFRSLLRSGTAGYSSAQIEISYPLRNPLFARTGGFVFCQLFKGYGATLLDYNRNSSTQVRLGFAIVR
jgi:hypothetical protein